MGGLTIWGLNIRHHSWRALDTAFAHQERSFSATSTLMKYINAHIPLQHLPLLLRFLILLPAWTHEERRGVFERKTGVPMGIPG